MADVFSNMLAPFLAGLMHILIVVFLVVLLAVLFFFGSFFVAYRLNPFWLSVPTLRAIRPKFEYHDLLRWKLIDFLNRNALRNEFKEYGFTFFVGRQGAGKTISMVNYLNRMKARYPKCVIVTNFSYLHADFVMVDWQDILNVRNGVDGVIFAIDEIHSEYSTQNWKDVPESLLSEISQQRKQRVKIVATAQFFSRVAKPLREQANTVVACTTSWGRWTKNREYDALEYAIVTDNPGIVKKKLKPLAKRHFVQSDTLRSEYDTYEKVERMRKLSFIPRNER